MNTQQVEIKRKGIEKIKWQLRRFFTMPRLHHVQFEPKGMEPAIGFWSVKKNEGAVFAEALHIEDEHQVELFNNDSIGFGKLLKMFIFALFER